MKGRKALIWPLGNIVTSSNVSSPLWGEFILFVPQDHIKVSLPFLSKIVTDKWRFYKASCWREKKGLWSVLGSHWFGWQAWLSVPHWRGILADAVGWLTQTQPPSNPPLPYLSLLQKLWKLKQLVDKMIHFKSVRYRQKRFEGWGP